MPVTPYIVAGKSQIGSTPIPLSKLMAQEDYDLLRPELERVDACFHLARPQDKARRWEYSMALRALAQAEVDQGRMYSTLIDVGGAGSPFKFMPTVRPVVIDPEESRSLHDAAEKGVTEGAVFCISVLEHIDDLYEFLADLDRITLPGGMLFLTVDCQEEDGPDDKHFHWMRKRIFSRKTWMELGDYYLGKGWEFLGWVDDRWRGAQVYDYAFASLALKKGALT